jgi:hypothetical protein
MEAQERLLHDVLGFRGAAEHAVRDREQQRSQLGVRLVHAVGSFPASFHLAPSTMALSVTARG